MLERQFKEYLKKYFSWSLLSKNKCIFIAIMLLHGKQNKHNIWNALDTLQLSKYNYEPYYVKAPFFKNWISSHFTTKVNKVILLLTTPNSEGCEACIVEQHIQRAWFLCSGYLRKEATVISIMLPFVYHEFAHFTVHLRIPSFFSMRIL